MSSENLIWSAATIARNLVIRKIPSFPRTIDRQVWPRVLQRLGGRTPNGHPSGILRLWPVWERIARRLWPTTDVPKSPFGVLSVHFKHYSGPPLVLNDGTIVRRSDHIAELHFNNARLIAALGDGKFAVLPLLRRELHALALWSDEPDFPAEVRAFFGYTILWRGAIRLGFTIRQGHITILRRLDRMFLSGLLGLYSSEGMTRLSKGRTSADYPQECWLSLAEVRTRYADVPGSRAL